MDSIADSDTRISAKTPSPLNRAWMGIYWISGRRHFCIEQTSLSTLQFYQVFSLLSSNSSLINHGFSPSYFLHQDTILTIVRTFTNNVLSALTNSNHPSRSKPMPSFLLMLIIPFLSSILHFFLLFFSSSFSSFSLPSSHFLLSFPWIILITIWHSLETFILTKTYMNHHLPTIYPSVHSFFLLLQLLYTQLLIFFHFTFIPSSTLCNLASRDTNLFFSHQQSPLCQVNENIHLLILSSFPYCSACLTIPLLNAPSLGFQHCTLLLFIWSHWSLIPSPLS